MAVTVSVPVTGAHGARISPKANCSTSRTATPVLRQTMRNSGHPVRQGQVGTSSVRRGTGR